MTVSRTGKHWFVGFQVEMALPDPVYPAPAEIGIDLGIATFAACSNGTVLPPLHALRTNERKLARAQHALSRKVKFVQHWKKQKARIKTLHTRMADSRHDFLHQHSTQISTNHAIIVLEDLQVWHMAKSAQEPPEEPGRNVAAKSGLNEALLDQGWELFRRMVEMSLDIE